MLSDARATMPPSIARHSDLVDETAAPDVDDVHAGLHHAERSVVDDLTCGVGEGYSEHHVVGISQPRFECSYELRL